MRAIDSGEGTRHLECGELCPHCGREVRDDIKLVLIAKRVRLNAPDRLFMKVSRQPILSEKQFVRALGVFDSRPQVVPAVETDRGLRQVAIEYRMLGK